MGPDDLFVFNRLNRFMTRWAWEICSFQGSARAPGRANVSVGVSVANKHIRVAPEVAALNL